MSSPKYTLYAVDYHYSGISYDTPILACSKVINDRPSLRDVINAIVEREKEIFDADVTNDVYIAVVEDIIRIYSDPEQYPIPETNEFFLSKKIVAAFGVDQDETDTYVVVEEDDDLFNS